MHFYKNFSRGFCKSVLSACLFAGVSCGGVAFAQSLPGQDQPPPPPAAADDLDFDDDLFDFERDPEEKLESTRKQAFDAALEGLLPLRPEEIRVLLERFDRTQESVELPVYPAPKPEVVVENINLDPGAQPAVVKTAYGHVTTISFLDASGAPWPITNMSWAGNFQVVEAEHEPAGPAPDGDQGGTNKFYHKIVISPQSEFAYGNMSISLMNSFTPVILTLETDRDVVHYRFDAVMPDYGPLAKAPLIGGFDGGNGLNIAAGSSGLSSALEGIVPQGAARLNVNGVDGRTSAFSYNGMTYVRTPLTLLSPAWSGSVSSLDGTRVYEIAGAPVLLLSDHGRVVRARLSSREDILDE